VKNVRRRAAKQPEKQKLRKIYNANNNNRLPGSIARSEGDPPTGDIAVDEAYDGLGITYDFFWDVYKRNSIDDKGMPLYAVVHYGERFNNAFWNGKQLVIGDGDGQLFNRFTASIDVIASDLVQGIIQAEAHLQHWHQSGALANSISDVFGSLVKQYFLKQTTTQADWLIGAGLLHSKVKGIALRSLASPGTAYDDHAFLGKDPQPAHMRNYLRTTADSGGVHINSGIPNHAFYLVARELGGYAWEKAGVIWYETLRDKRLKAKAQFRDFARLTLAKARQLYGGNSFEAKAVKRSWGMVGIKLGNP
jgi:Zn-dependent metalloprotease